MTEKNLDLTLLEVKTYATTFKNHVGQKVQAESVIGGPLNVFLLTAAQRAACLCNSFYILTTNNQYTTAATFIRMQIDNAMRYSALDLAKDKGAFIKAFLLGRRLDIIEAVNGKQMKDHYLIAELNKSVPGVADLYSETSGLIHLSGMHHHSHIKIIDENVPKNELKIELELSGEDGILSLNRKMIVAEKMKRACDIFFDLIKKS